MIVLNRELLKESNNTPGYVPQYNTLQYNKILKSICFCSAEALFPIDDSFEYKK